MESPTASSELKRKAEGEPEAAAATALPESVAVEAAAPAAPPDAPAEAAVAAAGPVAGAAWRGVTTRRVDRLPGGALLVCSQGSVVDFCGSAIVNAANRGCLGGGGVDGAISSAGGEALADARRALPRLRPGVRCETGDAVATCAGGELHCDHVIHAVGPDYYDYDTDGEADALLASAYKAAMAHAQRLGVRTLAFSLLSAAIYRAHRPLAVVLRIAVDALRAAAYDGLEEVHLVGFTSSEVRTLLEAAGAAAQEVEQDAAQVATSDAAPAAEADATAAA